jgi:hypothetical protein
MKMKHVKDSSPVEQAATLAALKRGQKPELPEPEPLPLGKHASELSEAERAEWLREHIRRFK